MQIQAAVLRELNTPFQIETLELDAPHPGEVLLEVAAAGLCGSDLHAISGSLPCKLPSVRGHEGAGVVVALGEGVSTLSVGDLVVTTFVASCGLCYQCVRGRRTSCVNGIGPQDGTLLDGTYRLHDAHGMPVGTGSRLAAFATHTVVPAISCIPVPAKTNLTSAALLSCGLTTGLGASINIARVGIGDAVAVFGAGGVGIAAIQGAVISGAATIVAIDLNSAKGERALRFGATDFIDAKTTDVLERLRELTSGFGVDAAILSTDVVGSDLIRTAMSALGPGGRTVLVGKADNALDNIPISPGQMMFRQTSFHATLAGTMNQAEDIVKYLDLSRTGRLDLDSLVTKTYSLQDINHAVDDLKSGINIRGVIDFSAAAGR